MTDVRSFTGLGPRQAPYRFCALADCADGSRPHALVMDPAGNLLVSTAFGGTGDDGGAVVELVND